MTAARYARYAYFPILIYALGLMAKLTFGDLSVDLEGVHSVMGAVFLAYGAAVCYFMTLMPLPRRTLPYGFWILASLLFFLIFCDATFGIHERMPRLGLPEQAFFVLEGALLIAVVAPWARLLYRHFYYALALFALVSGVAVLGDASASHEGTLTVFGHAWSFEQTLETFSVLVLATAFTLQALHEVAGARDADAPAPLARQTRQSLGRGARIGNPAFPYRTR